MDDGRCALARRRYRHWFLDVRLPGPAVGHAMRFLTKELRHGSIVVFTGLMGSGKTGCMSLMANYQKLLSGRQVRSNYRLGCADLRVSSFDDLVCENSIIVLDELQLTVDARSFASKKNLELSHWAELRIRKRNNLLLATVQDFDMLDANFRRLTAYVLDCEYRSIRGSDACRVRIFQNMRYGTFSSKSSFVLAHSTFYGLYDTHDEDVVISSNASDDKKPVRGPDRASAVTVVPSVSRSVSSKLLGGY